MPDLADLARLGPTVETDHPDPARERVDASETPRYTEFLPRPRGVLKPVVGPVEDASVVRALALCGGGWLHRDGRIATRGSCEGIDYMRRLPETAAVFRKLQDDVASAEASLARLTAEELAEHRASGRPDSTFSYGDEWFSSLDPERDARLSLDNLGWVELGLRQDRGVKEILCLAGGRNDPLLDRHLSALAKALSSRVVTHGWRPNPNIVFEATGRKNVPYVTFAPSWPAHSANPREEHGPGSTPSF